MDDYFSGGSDNEAVRINDAINIDCMIREYPTRAEERPCNKSDQKLEINR